MLFRLRHYAQKQHADMDTDTELTQVPFNTVLWAFAYNGRLDIVRLMYHVVRAYVTEAAGGSRTTEVEDGKGDGKGNRERDGEELEELECVLAKREVVPDAATYHSRTVHGNPLETAIADMLSASSPSPSLSSTTISPLTGHHYDEQQQLCRRRCAQAEAEVELDRQGEFVASLASFRSYLSALRDTASSTSIIELSIQNNNHPTSPASPPPSSPSLYHPPFLTNTTTTTTTTDNNNNDIVVPSSPSPIIPTLTPATAKNANGRSRRSTPGLPASSSFRGTRARINRRSSCS
jgi:hypothetical protein